jgi:hypothetical protein
MLNASLIDTPQRKRSVDAPLLLSGHSVCSRNAELIMSRSPRSHLAMLLLQLKLSRQAHAQAQFEQLARLESFMVSIWPCEQSSARQLPAHRSRSRSRFHLTRCHSAAQSRTVSLARRRIPERSQPRLGVGPCSTGERDAGSGSVESHSSTAAEAPRDRVQLLEPGCLEILRLGLPVVSSSQPDPRWSGRLHSGGRDQSAAGAALGRDAAAE